jgi:fluoride exporter
VPSAHPFRGRHAGSRDTGSRDIRSRLARVFTADDRLPIDPDLEPTDPSEPAPAHRRVPVPVRRSHPGVMLAIAAGGALGAVGRYELELAWPVHPGRFPASTFVINTSGAFLLGFLLTLSIGGQGARRWRYARFFGCVGVLGAWTTMSTVAVEADTLVRGGAPVVALVYLAATMAAGLAAAAVGLAAGRRRGGARAGAVGGGGVGR